MTPQHHAGSSHPVIGQGSTENAEFHWRLSGYADGETGLSIKIIVAVCSYSPLRAMLLGQLKPVVH